MSNFVKLRYILKVVSAAAWVIILPVTYAYSSENPGGFAGTIKGWFGNGSSSPPLFILAVIMYLSPNMLAAILFLFPSIRRFLERSDYRVVMLMMWWSQVCICLLDYPLSVLLYWLRHCTRSIANIFILMMQPRLYVGRGMHESMFSLFK